MPEALVESLAPQPELAVENWGLTPYREALARQEEYVESVSRELKPETLIFCTHPPIVTLGRGTRPGDVFGWTGDTIEVSRGGRATYHGPSQIVVYPILDLTSRGRDLHKYMRSLEAAIIETLAAFAVHGEAHTLQLEDGAEAAAEATGVWIGARKIASIGIAVRRWITYHGLALNVTDDPSAFSGMKPCGFAPGSVISMQEILSSAPDRAAVESHLVATLTRRL